MSRSNGGQQVSESIEPIVAQELDGLGFELVELRRGGSRARPVLEIRIDRRDGEKVTIVGATSGDTGSAAIEALRDRESAEVFILHPAGRVSDVQRRQMTTVDAPNVHNIAVEGTFDDCQDLVKALFADDSFRDSRNLSAVNSINWARVMAQIVYYVTSATRLGGGAARPVAFSVPTGNFGNVFAGYGAQRMGTPISQFVVASNRNDILTQFLTTGTMTIGEVHPTLSPSMDIQVSSNLERLLFEIHGRDGAAIAEMMARFRSEGTVSVGDVVYQVSGKANSEPLYPDDPSLPGNRRIAIVLLREAPVLPPEP
ncbi:MAG: threonine synthase, partial [Proteobacteria bacterium]|nr:threonine synthase [Pseudomonadota bacterium]